MISTFSLPSQIFQFINQLLSIYYYMIIARIILTWVINSYTLENHPLGYWLCLLTTPFLRIFRRLPFAIIGGIVDISPVLALFAINLIQRFFRTLAASQGVPFSAVLLTMIFRLVLNVISIFQTLFIVIALILLFRLLYQLFHKQSNYNIVTSHIDFYIRKLIQGRLRSLNLYTSKFTTQLVSILSIFLLLIYLLSLCRDLLTRFFSQILNNF